MIVFISIIGIILLVFAWLLITPLTFCINTDQPTSILQVELKGIMKYWICVRDNRIFVHSRIFFFTSEEELFKKKKSPADSKKKLTEKKRRQSGGVSGL